MQKVYLNRFSSRCLELTGLFDLTGILLFAAGDVTDLTFFAALVIVPATGFLGFHSSAPSSEPGTNSSIPSGFDDLRCGMA